VRPSPADFAKDYAVAVSARSPDYLKSLGDEIRPAGGRSLEVPTDVTDRTQVAAAFKIRTKLLQASLKVYV